MFTKNIEFKSFTSYVIFQQCLIPYLLLRFEYYYYECPLKKQLKKNSSQHIHARTTRQCEMTIKATIWNFPRPGPKEFFTFPLSPMFLHSPLSLKRTLHSRSFKGTLTDSNCVLLGTTLELLINNPLMKYRFKVGLDQSDPFVH